MTVAKLLYFIKRWSTIICYKKWTDKYQVNLNMIYIYIPTTAKYIVTRFNNYRWKFEVLGRWSWQTS